MIVHLVLVDQPSEKAPMLDRSRLSITVFDTSEKSHWGRGITCALAYSIWVPIISSSVFEES